MISFKELHIRAEGSLQKTKEIISGYQQVLGRFFLPGRSILSKVYAFTIWVVSKTCEFLTFVISKTATSIHFLASKIDQFFKYIRRKLYVRKILSARHQWYVNKGGNFYNPKIKATIYPSWECTWNIAQSSDHYPGYESKKQAQEVAFKMWMKMRRLKKRLDMPYLETKIPISLTQKILPNKVQLRPSTLQDIPPLLTLMEQLGYPQAIESMKERIQSYSAYSHESHHQILVAIRGKKIVGFIAFVLYDLFISEGKRCRIEGLIVDPKERDLSIKRKLMQAVETFARENDGRIIDLTADLHPAKEGMGDFYKFLGYSNEGAMAKAYLKKEL